ncbi:conserved hypothetical protein [Xylella fastidiosa M12]|nr:conserved hypothetical protein [Xylella fastidiosa M12]
METSKFYLKNVTFVGFLGALLLNIEFKVALTFVF